MFRLLSVRNNSSNVTMTVEGIQVTLIYAFHIIVLYCQETQMVPTFPLLVWIYRVWIFFVVGMTFDQVHIWYRHFAAKHKRGHPSCISSKKRPGIGEMSPKFNTHTRWNTVPHLARKDTFHGRFRTWVHSNIMCTGTPSWVAS